MPYGPRIVANRDTSPQKRQACTGVAAFASPARMSTPLDADVSQGICDIRTPTGRTFPQQPPADTPGPHRSTTQRITSYLGSVDDPIIARSALKHGLGEADILHAYHHPIRAWDMGDGFTMLLGANHAALVLEIGYIQGITTIVIVHAMRAREKFLR